MNITINPDNPRTISKEKFEKLKKSIKEFPQMLELRPIVVDKNGVILGGNMRYKAIQKLGLEVKDEWVKVADKLSDEERRRFIVEDNLGFGDWDFDSLSSQYDVDELVDWGFDERELQIDKEVIEDEPPEVDDVGEPVSKLGEIYQLGRHRLGCLDATKIEDVELLMGGKRANMVFTDPPYNVDYQGGIHADGTQTKRSKIINDKMSSEQFYNFLYSVMSNLISVTDGAFYVCMSSSELHNLWRAFTDCGGHWQTYVIWAKNAFTLGRSDYQHQFEPIMYGLTESEVNRAIDEVDEDKLPIMYGWTKHYWYGGRKQGDVCRFDKPTVSKEHPTMKPIALCAKAIQNSSMRGEIVLDTFGGSGSTLIASEQVDRVCYMSELDPKYCDVIRKRYWRFTHDNNEDGWQEGTNGRK